MRIQYLLILWVTFFSIAPQAFCHYNILCMAVFRSYQLLICNWLHIFIWNQPTHQWYYSFFFMQLNWSSNNFADLDKYYWMLIKLWLSHLATTTPAPGSNYLCDSLDILIKITFYSFLTYPVSINKADSSRSLLRVSFLATTPSEGVLTLRNCGTSLMTSRRSSSLPSFSLRKSRFSLAAYSGWIVSSTTPLTLSTWTGLENPGYSLDSGSS